MALLSYAAELQEKQESQNQMPLAPQSTKTKAAAGCSPSKAAQRPVQKVTKPVRESEAARQKRLEKNRRSARRHRAKIKNETDTLTEQNAALTLANAALERKVAEQEQTLNQLHSSVAALALALQAATGAVSPIDVLEVLQRAVGAPAPPTAASVPASAAPADATLAAPSMQTQPHLCDAAATPFAPAPESAAPDLTALPSPKDVGDIAQQPVSEQAYFGRVLSGSDASTSAHMMSTGLTIAQLDTKARLQEAVARLGLPQDAPALAYP